MSAHELPVAGMESFSTVDFPGCLAAVVFTQGCPWRCSYCHNPHLQPETGAAGLPWSSIRGILEARRGLLNAVVFSGGEPTLHPDLPEAVREVKRMGFLAGLHTAGMFPDRLKVLLPWVDWIGLDIKAPLDQRYEDLTQSADSARQTAESLDLLLRSGVKFQLRTTVDPAIHSSEDLDDLQSDLRRRGAPPARLQSVRSIRCAEEYPQDTSHDSQ